MKSTDAPELSVPASETGRAAEPVRHAPTPEPEVVAPAPQAPVETPEVAPSRWSPPAKSSLATIVILLLVLTWPGRIEDYWFRVAALSAALLLVVGLIEMSRRIGAAPAAAGAVLLAVGLVLLPYRIRAASQLGRLPAYGPLVRASRALASSAGRVRDVAAPWYPGVIEGIPIGGFIPNTPNEDVAAVYEFAGGRLDQSARQSAVLHEDGTFELRND